ncbi:cytoplasmic dynein 2 heavy chain 1-like [Ostrinia furnacalis]|uniref:cytoplasmic dynein 2 heavy chain 1-like n=1 Tax=Ostrinia furnacalis TaxID=93504 RepID=UPI00103D976B|nr:cytoplasmic dynein 2 heavy chain 1-like [Ostrinia furnacalis]
MARVRELVLHTAEHYYNTTNLNLNPKSEECLSEFIHHPQTLVLQALIQDNTILLFTKMVNDKQKSIIFYKPAALDLAADDAVNSINIITLSNNVAESLYHILKQIYSPLLANNNDLISNKLHKNLADLESNLRIITQGKGSDNTVILSVDDEIEYWRSVVDKRDASKKEKEGASAFLDLFEDISEELRSMLASNMSETREAVENVGGLLDDVWRLSTFPYTQERMIHMFDVIAYFICSIVQKAFPSVDLWKVKEGIKEIEILNILMESLKVIQTWISACKSLTETYWPNYALHIWSGKPYIPAYCVNFEKRLKEIHEIRSTYTQLNKLLTNYEKDELKIQYLFEPFENINVWICNGQNQAWETAISRFSSSLRPAETKIAEKLKPRLHNTSSKQMLYEFMRYKALIDRPLVKQALNNELETFVSSLLSMVKAIKNQLDSEDIDVQMYQPPEMSLVVQQIQWAKQTEAKVKDIRTCADKYLVGFDGTPELVKLADQVLKDLKTLYTQLHEEWSRDLQAQVKNGSLQLSSDEPVVQFSGDSQLMVVRYDGRATRLEREARALRALALPPPPPAAAALDQLGRALCHAQRLHQVASFHNTLGERMIPSTRPMMLQAAMDLSRLVRDQKAAYWNDTDHLAKYTDDLKRIVLKLESQNTYLTNQHIAIRNIVESLLDTELLAQQSEWKKKIKDIRDIIEKVEANGYKNTESWRTHWDWQLYKVLECQYIKTLLSLHKHFPHVKVDLVLRGHMVRVQPPMEEVRAQHYHQLRRLVSLPAQLVGLQPAPASANAAASAVFGDIVRKHSWLGNKAVQQLEAALLSLERTCRDWTRRLALACARDIPTLCAQLTEPAQFEDNFKACKAYGQAVAKMTFEDEKIEWISVGTASLRREVEACARSLWANLAAALQNSARADAAALDAFVARASQALQGQTAPKNARELAEISAVQQALRNNMPEMEKTVEALKRKSHMLRTWGGDASADGSIKEWHKVRELMLSQQQMFEHQAEIVKSSMSGEWENLNTSVEAWMSRWDQNKPRLEETRGASYSEMADRCRSVFEAHATWEKFVTDRDILIKECEKFDMKLEPTKMWAEAEKLMTEYVNVWTVLKDYNEEFDAISEQEWIVFQKKLHLLDEFVSKWSDKLEPFTVVTLFIQQDLERYSDLSTLLKYLRGSDFTERHWREVFSLLEMEYKKPDTLQVKDFLAVALNIKKQIKALQKICTTASSEAAVRSALNELELWFAGARLAITYYNDKSKRPTPIVKDFKDILAKIEEQQWIVGSVSGGGGGDACAAWESRLRAARTLVRAAHHAQRRSVHKIYTHSNDSHSNSNAAITLSAKLLETGSAKRGTSFRFAVRRSCGFRIFRFSRLVYSGYNTNNIHTLQRD